MEDCNKIHNTGGYCKTHYSRNKRYGDPLGGMTTYNGDLPKWVLENLDYSGEACLIWPFGGNGHGYGKMSIDGVDELVHTVIATIVYGPKPSPKHEILHACGNGKLGCVAPLHLRWGTRAENESDKLVHGKSNRGERQGNSKLREDEILAIREDKRPSLEVSDDYGITIQHVRRIRKGKTWSWLTNPPAPQPEKGNL